MKQFFLRLLFGIAITAICWAVVVKSIQVNGQPSLLPFLSFVEDAYAQDASGLSFEEQYLQLYQLFEDAGVACTGTRKECADFGDYFCGQHNLECDMSTEIPCIVCSETSAQPEPELTIEQEVPRQSSSSRASIPMPARVNTLCGNGVLDAGEQCGEPGFSCPAGQLCNQSSCMCMGGSLCGNGEIDAGEQCGEPGLACGAGQACNREICMCSGGGLCGNGEANPGEQCGEPGLSCGAGTKCDTFRCLCSGKEEVIPPQCGNGAVDAVEECDDGNELSGDGCSAACLLESGRCGDGVLQKMLGEQCEPSLHSSALPFGCSDLCRFVSPACGDSVVDPGEQCDLGSENADTPNSPCRTDCGARRCGDGILDYYSESCDDGNRISGDGCDHSCRVERIVSVNAQQDHGAAPGDVTKKEGNVMEHKPNAVPSTGPATLVAIGMGAAAGVAWMRRKKPVNQ